MSRPCVRLCLRQLTPCSQWRLFSLLSVSVCRRNSKHFQIFFSSMQCSPKQRTSATLASTSACSVNTRISSINMRQSHKAHFASQNTSKALSGAGHPAWLFTSKRLKKRIRRCTRPEDKSNSTYSISMSPSTSAAYFATDMTRSREKGPEPLLQAALESMWQHHQDFSAKYQN